MNLYPHHPQPLQTTHLTDSFPDKFLLLLLVRPIYSPKISGDLIPTLYKIGKSEGKPMTKIVDKFLRDSIDSYLNNSNSHNPSIINYKSGLSSYVINDLSVGETVETPYGVGKVTEIRYWKDIEKNMDENDGKEKLRKRIEFIFGDTDKYFEFTVAYEQGDTSVFECREYRKINNGDGTNP